MVRIRLVTILLISLSLAACSMAGNMNYRTIQIKNSTIGVQFVPRQITRVMEDQLGYQRIVVREFVPEYGDNEATTTASATGMLIESIVDYRMVFLAEDMPSLRVRVRIVKSTGTINIGVVENGSRQLSAEGDARVRQLVSTFGNLYGPENLNYRG